jgi:3-dehydroquinate dehydratase/shikimate dehydrogenase
VNNGKICVSVAAETADEMIERIKRAEKLADIIEVRFDCLSKQEFDVNDMSKAASAWTRILDSTSRPLISTFRPKFQGGCRDLTTEERRNFWNSGFETDLCDVEEDFVQDTFYWMFFNRICSFHYLSAVRADVSSDFDRLSATGAKTIKIAAPVDDVVESIPIWKLLKRAKAAGKGMIPIAMGEAGKWTRILGLAHDAFLTYTSLERGSETATGQLTIDEALNVYRVKQLDLQTKVYGVVGQPVSESLSPYIHNAAFVVANINAVFVPLQVKDIGAFFRRMVLPATREVELNFAGFAVTMPHKQSVMKYLDQIDSVGEKIGAVNTIATDNDKLFGYNTDVYGFVTPLKSKLGELNGMRAAVLGAGGAARACVTSLKQEGADVTVFARDEVRARAFSSEFALNWNTLSNLKFEISHFDLVVNATPLGMMGEFEAHSPLTSGDLKGVKLVFDLVTSPNDTPLMREAKQAGVATISGVEMLIEQAIKQFEIWTGLEAPKEVMRAVALGRSNRTNER